MKASIAPLPVGAGWVYELKWDGIRAAVEVRGGEVQVWSSNGRDITVTYPELAALGPTFAHLDVVLDGEVVALQDGRPSFSRLQQRMHVSDPVDAARRAVEVPVELVLFDVLEIGGQPTTGLPWQDRRRLLESLADDLPPGVELARTFTDGESLLEVARQSGFEGVMAKRVDSHYDPGRRSPSWRKIKVRLRQEVVIGGWQPGEGVRLGRPGSLLVGYHDPAGGPLRYAGKVGTGFSDAELVRLQRLFAERAVEASPFDPPPPRLVDRVARYIRPDLVCELEFGDWTDEGILRHASYLGLRDDKDAAEVVREI
jgi:bifunctional non-homologous end joining protein LigD